MWCCYIYVKDINGSLKPGGIIRCKFSPLFIFRGSPFSLSRRSFIVIFTVASARVKKIVAINLELSGSLKNEALLSSDTKP